MKRTEKHNKTILYVHHSTALGGASISLCDIAKDQVSKGRKAIFICPGKGPAAEELFKEIGEVLFIKLPLFSHTTASSIKPWNVYTIFRILLNSIPGIFTIWRICRKRHISIAHFNSSCLFISAIGAKLAGTKVILHIREIIAKGFFGIRKHIITSIIKLISDKIIAVSYSAAAPFGETDKLKVVYNGIELNKFNNKNHPYMPRRFLGIGEDTKVIGFIGQILPTKGIFSLLDIFKNVLKIYPNTKLVICGEYNVDEYSRSLRAKFKDFFGIVYDFKKKLIKKINEENLKGKITYLNYQKDIENVYDCFDIFAFPSIGEGFGRPIVEAWAMRVPVVTFDAPSMNELIKDGKDGFLVSCGNTDEFAEKIVYLFNHPEKVRNITDAAFEKSQRFSIEDNLRQIRQIYEIV